MIDLPAFWRAHSTLGYTYATNGNVIWSGSSGWWIIETIESFNGLRRNSDSGQGFFLQWFSQNAFGGSNYSNTPVGAVSHVYEPGLDHVNDPSPYFWALGSQEELWDLRLELEANALLPGGRRSAGNQIKL